MFDSAKEKIVTFVLDGKDVSVTEGSTIWEAANGQGLKIPHLCHKPEPGYRSDGNCRACMVEIEGERVLAASCIRSVSEGMVVKSESERAKIARATVIELLVADQPKLAHDASSHFWDMVEATGVEESRFPTRDQSTIPLLDDSHVAMKVNLDSCIHCNLCVRACREVQVNDVIGMGGRGLGSQVIFDMADAMGDSTCVGCGQDAVLVRCTASDCFTALCCQCVGLYELPEEGWECPACASLSRAVGATSVRRLRGRSPSADVGARRMPGHGRAERKARNALFALESGASRGASVHAGGGYAR